MMRSDKARDAFDMSKESASITSLFGDDGFQQSCLLATRLVESGVKFVTVSLGGWDTHGDNFNALKNKLLPNFDAGLAGLFRALEAKGLLASTGVFVTGEFGRTPKINKNAGRDHYPRSMFCLLGGGGIKGGQVVGESDAKAEHPKDKRHHPRRRGRHVLQVAGHRPHQGIPHPRRPPGDDHAIRERDSGIAGVRQLQRCIQITAGLD